MLHVSLSQQRCRSAVASVASRRHGCSSVLFYSAGGPLAHCKEHARDSVWSSLAWSSAKTCSAQCVVSVLRRSYAVAFLQNSMSEAVCKRRAVSLSRGAWWGDRERQGRDAGPRRRTPPCRRSGRPKLRGRGSCAFGLPGRRRSSAATRAASPASPRAHVRGRSSWERGPTSVGAGGQHRRSSEGGGAGESAKGCDPPRSSVGATGSRRLPSRAVVVAFSLVRAISNYGGASALAPPCCPCGASAQLAMAAQGAATLSKHGAWAEDVLWGEGRAWPDAALFTSAPPQVP